MPGPAPLSPMLRAILADAQRAVQQAQPPTTDAAVVQAIMADGIRSILRADDRARQRRAEAN